MAGLLASQGKKVGVALGANGRWMIGGTAGERGARGERDTLSGFGHLSELYTALGATLSPLLLSARSLFSLSSMALFLAEKSFRSFHICGNFDFFSLE